MKHVSVVIPLYNKVNYISRALHSVLNQSYEDFEVIVIDDGSDDDGDKIVEAIQDRRISLIRQPSSGAAAARNTGIKAAKGDWIAFLDADDIWYSDNLATHMSLLDHHPDVNWSAGLYNRRLSNGKIEKVVLSLEFEKVAHNEVIEDFLLFLPYGYICTDTVVIRKPVFDEIGFMDTALRTTQDLDMWLRLALVYPKLTYSNHPIAEYYTEIADSNTKYKTLERGEPSHVIFARKYLKVADELKPERAIAVRTLCLNQLNARIRRLMINGYRDSAMRIVDEFETFLGSLLCQEYRLLAKLPTRLLRLMAATRRKYRNWRCGKPT